MGALAVRLVGPLTRLAATARWSTFVAILSKYAKVSMTSLKDVVTWAGNNKGAAMLISTSLVEAGVSIVDFFKGENGKLADEDKSIVTHMSQAISNPAMTAFIADMLDNDGDKFVAPVASKDRFKEQVARSTLAWARNFFSQGNTNGLEDVLAAHASLQLFAAMPHAYVVELMSDATAPIPRYTKEMRTMLSAAE